MKYDRDLCILGGIFVILEYADMLCTELCRYLFKQTSWHFFDFLVSAFENISYLAWVVFIILFFMCFFGKKCALMQKFMEKFPKISVYLFYLGLVSYILFLINLIIIIIVYYAQFGGNIEKYLGYTLISVNIGGFLWALIIATKRVFFNRNEA